MLAAGCFTIKRRIEVRKEEIRPQLESTEENLLASYNEQARAVQTLQATVDLIPSTGSTHSGVVEEYHDVTGFILAERPAAVRVIGQAPVVAKNIFDMFSDGDEFRIYIPSKNEFLIGPATLTRASDKPIQNFRPNHIVEALFWPDVKPGKNVLFEQFDLDEGRYYILTLLREVDGGKLETARKIWYDRANLCVSRVQLFVAAGRLDSDIAYSDWRPAGTTPATGIVRVAAQISYARDIKIWRPQDDYKLEIQILKLTLNEHISADRFVLNPPDGSDLVHIGQEISGPADDPAVRLK
jgi:outer membrane lipoprotein-sorting protein